MIVPAISKYSISITFALVTVALVSWQSSALPNKEGARWFQSQVRNAAENLPARSGPWVSTDIKPTEGAVRLLRPNVLLQRRWTNLDTNITAEVLLVHCGDARDMLGHYPPVCYAGQGWQLTGKEEWSTTIDGKSYHLPEYDFVTSHGTAVEGRLVRDGMMLPGVGLGHDMDDVMQASRNVERRALGAGQFQVIFDRRVPADVRQKATDELLAIYRPVFEVIVKGATSAGSPGDVKSDNIKSGEQATKAIP